MIGAELRRGLVALLALLALSLVLVALEVDREEPAPLPVPWDATDAEYEAHVARELAVIEAAGRVR